MNWESEEQHMKNTTHLFNKPSPGALYSHPVFMRGFYESFCGAHPYQSRHSDYCRGESSNNTRGTSLGAKTPRQNISQITKQPGRNKTAAPSGTAGEILLQRGGDWSPKAIILLSKSGFQIQTFCPKTPAKAVFRWLHGGLLQQFSILTLFWYNINSLLVQVAQGESTDFLCITDSLITS